VVVGGVRGKSTTTLKWKTFRRDKALEGHLVIREDSSEDLSNVLFTSGLHDGLARHPDLIDLPVVDEGKTFVVESQKPLHVAAATRGGESAQSHATR
jgi:hypothetical protein